MTDKPAFDDPRDSGEELFDVRAPLFLFRRLVTEHPLVIAATTVLTVVLAMGYVWMFDSVYESQVTMLSEAEVDKGRENFYAHWNVFRKDDVASEPRLAVGGTVLAEVMQELNLGWNDVYHSPMSQVSHWWSKSWLGDQYRGVKHFIFPPAETEWDMTPEQREQLWALVEFKYGVRFDAIDKTTVGSIVVKGPTKQVADIANKIAEVYLKQRGERHRAEAQAAYDVLAKHRATAQARVSEIDHRVQKLREDNEIYLEFEKEKVTVTQWTTMESDILNLRADLAQQETQAEVMQRQLMEEPLERTTSTTFQLDELKETLRAGLLDNELAMLDALQKYQPDSPEVRELDQIITELRRRLDTTDDMILAGHDSSLNQAREDLRVQRNGLLAASAGARARLEVLLEAEQNTKDNLQDLPRRQRELHSVLREASVAQGELQILTDRFVQARVSLLTAGQTLPSIRVIEPAMSPDKPLWPKTKYMLLGGLIAGFFFGLAAAWLWELLDGRVRKHHVDKGLGSMELYGRLHRMPRHVLKSRGSRILPQTEAGARGGKGIAKGPGLN